eukprot:COSAG01_NODE_2025_length_8604_cov_16.296296_10_plen_128_part_00
MPLYSQYTYIRTGEIVPVYIPVDSQSCCQKSLKVSCRKLCIQQFDFCLQPAARQPSLRKQPASHSQPGPSCPDCMLAKSANHCINTMDGTLCIMCRLHDLLIRYTKKVQNMTCILAQTHNTSRYSQT